MPATPPRATARLQFHAGFTLHDAVPLVPYFARLGISHLYASPLLTARPGSTHGYDIVDHSRINPELGGEPALERLVQALHAHEMGLILDIVPNHMGVGGSDNAWWLDVLEWGRQSAYAGFFDIDWNPPDASLRNRLLAPFLGAPYGAALASGDLAMRFDAAAGKLFIGYFEHRFPLHPPHIAGMLRLAANPALAPAIDAFAAIPAGERGRALARDAEAVLAGIAATPPGALAIAQVLAAFAPDQEAGRARLHRLLERQHYRLAWWRTATDEINWRRFFDVNALAGLRVERPEVYDATHELIERLYAEGSIDGLRIDHVDGLADPRRYLRKLRRRMQALRPDLEPLIWVEKILAPFEALRPDWQTDGTTGYDFMDRAAAVLHDPAGEAPLTTLWSETTGRPAAFEAEAVAARRQILRDNLASELNAAAVMLKRVADQDLVTRDVTLTALRRVLAEVLAHFPVYRLYITPAGRDEEDRRILTWALAGARRALRAKDQPLLELLDTWLGGEAPRGLPQAQRRARLAAAVRFQQLSAPTAAKSVEDTGFYRYGRLISRNEVGSEPSRFAMTPTAFHAINRNRAQQLPQALLATATHDHKRGEDARARLAVLSELPEEWATALTRWTRLNAPLKREAGGAPAPDAADEAMLYQTLLGAWPPGLDASDVEGTAELRTRVAAWQEKALREAKRHSEWAVPDEAYEQACTGFLDHLFDPSRQAPVLGEIAALAERLSPAGAINGLAQLLLRCTAPGVPDLYQGTELWDFSLVDPDNRRPVDFPLRERSLADGTPPAQLLNHWRDGRVKQAILHRALLHRARHPALYAEGSYEPLAVEGPMAGHVLAFGRRLGKQRSVTVVTRLAARLVEQRPHVAPELWAETKLVLPRHYLGIMRDSLLQEAAPSAPSIRIGDLLRHLPVALLEGE
ncbi:malto-oligosyltrehalose synthase [Plastoroseomonas arctica]|uniref:Malto-oligosyltrehalose synthase n=1 Tax=Plastoroseomonas arctica TaxID=1509237 RepID=A0AAF1KRP6_9PROT|nr:malto-oligosyltrehalose synthase [Plastoroseomonas arctica]MBR0654627.1 malto-oligosyltrehalose synthase [Plastoroseomonas arctica]